jgi:hypothetical protein
VTDFLGYLRDLIMAAFGLAVLFGVTFTDQQITGVVVFATALVTFVAYTYQRWTKGDGTPAGKSRSRR